MLASSAANRPQAGIYRYRVGAFQITALSDGSGPFDAHALFPGLAAARIDELLYRAFSLNPVEASYNAYLIDTGSRLVLVDTGSGDFGGNLPGSNLGLLVSRLKTAGYVPAQIDDILLTHLHADHCGGLVDRGRMVFPRAIIHVAKADVDYYLDPAHQQGAGNQAAHYFQQATASLTPYIRAGRLQMFSAETQIVPGIEAIPVPGHTPGHSFYLAQSQGQSIEFVGDVVHSQAVQMPLPDTTAIFDVDAQTARAQRLEHFARIAEGRQLIAVAHFSFPGLGHIRSEGAAYEFVPVDYRDRPSP